MTPRLNEFQRSIQERLQRILIELGHQSAVEISDEAEECDAVVKVGNLEFWIYPDGANVQSDTVDERFEIYDFKSLDELQDAYIRFAGDLLRRRHLG